MIVTEDLSKQFDDFLAVDGVNLSVPAGKILVLLGPNGAGKTTTVRMLTSILVPTRGRASVAGFDVVRQADQVRASVGVLTEQHGLYGRMSAGEYLEFFAHLYGMKRVASMQRISELLEKFGLADARKKRLSEYSKGMRQKLALVRALLHEPPVLLLDEPTSAMDPESARVVRDAIHTLRSADRTIVLCTHNLAEADELADQIAFIRRGRIVMDGPREKVKRAILGPAEYQVTFSRPVDGFIPSLPAGVKLIAREENWLRFQIDQPEVINPILLGHLLEEDYPVISFAEVSRSLEEVYLQVMGQAEKGEDNAA